MPLFIAEHLLVQLQGIRVTLAKCLNTNQKSRHCIVNYIVKELQGPRHQDMNNYNL